MQHISTGKYAKSMIYHIKVQDRHYKHEPATVRENQTATILWDMPIQTDKEIKANRPGIVVKDKKERTCLLMDMSIPTERNTSLKTVEKITKYKDLELKIEKTRGMKVAIVPVIIGALGLEKIYQTLETVFHWLSKQLKFRYKYSAARRIFNSPRCLDIPMKHCLCV